MVKRNKSEITEPAFEIRRLDRLRPHPLQGLYFGNFSDMKLRALADDIDRYGLKHCIEVLPKNQAQLPVDTIIVGHKRHRALQLLGFEETEVEVRYDLSEANAAEIELYFLDDNDNRQHLTKLAQARIALRRVEIEKKRDRGDLADWEHVEARDRVGAAIGMTGRNLSRYLRVLQTPASVQQAFERGELTLVAADRVAGLCDEIRSVIAARIEAGEAPKSVVQSAVGTVSRKPKDVETSFRRYMKALTKSIEHLPDAVKEIRFAPKSDELIVLKVASELNTALAKQLRANEFSNSGQRDHAVKAIGDELAAT